MSSSLSPATPSSASSSATVVESTPSPSSAVPLIFSPSTITLPSPPSVSYCHLPNAITIPSSEYYTNAKHTVHDSFASAVGKTSLVKLRAISHMTGCNVYAKCEFENPGGSVKDRAALYIVAAAEKAGLLIPHDKENPGWIVEGTAGNTGIGLTCMANARGYKSVIVMASNNSQEKKDFLRWLGAHVLEVPFVPFSNPNNYVHVAARVAAQLKAEGKRVLLGDQWSAPGNRQAHYEGTGPEIYEQLHGKVDGFICGVGTGGTLTGTAQFLREKNPQVKIGLADPHGAGIAQYFQHGQVKPNVEGGSTISEGIGQMRLTDNLIRGGFRPDYSFVISDTFAYPFLWQLLMEEGLCAGSSSAHNIAGAYLLAKQLGPGHNIVTILCDSGTRYASKLYNPTFLKEKNVPIPPWLDETQRDVQTSQHLSDVLKSSFVEENKTEQKDK